VSATNGGGTGTATLTLTISPTGPPSNFTVVQAPNSCGSAGNCECNIASGAKSCTMTLNSAPQSGNLYVIMGYPQNTNTGTESLSSVTNLNGTLVKEPGCTGYSTYIPICGYILPSTSAGGTTSITINISAPTSGSDNHFAFWELHPNGNGAGVALDNAGALYQASSSSLVGPPFTASGSNDATFTGYQPYGGFTFPSSVSSPYNTYAYIPSAEGVSGAISTAVPTWTPTSATAAIIAGMSFGWNPAPCAENSFVDFEAGSAGASVTAALLQSSTHGWQGGVWSKNGSNSPFTFQSTASMPLVDATGRLCGDGKNYTANAGSLGITLTGNGTVGSSEWNYLWKSNALTNVTASVWWSSDLVATDTSLIDCFYIHGQADFVGVGCYGNGTNRYFRLEAGSGSPAMVIPYTPGTLAHLQLAYNVAGTHSLTVTDAAVITAASCTAGTTTLTVTALPPDLVTGANVTVAQVNPSVWNGNFSNVTVSGNNVSYAQTCPGSGYSSGGIVLLPAQNAITTSAVGTDNPQYVSIGNGSNSSSVTKGRHLSWDSLRISLIGAALNP
jgi:hypothetical protein